MFRPYACSDNLSRYPSRYISTYSDGMSQDASSMELAHMDEVDRVPWEATEPDEKAILDKLYEYNERTGTYHSHVGD